MVSTRQKRQSNRTLLSQINDFDQDTIIGNAASERPESFVVNEGTNDREVTVGTSTNGLATNQKTVNVKTLERCFKESIDSGMSNIVDTFENSIKNATLNAIDSNAAFRIELAINASSGEVATNVTANSERGEHVGIIVPSENASGNNNVLHVRNVDDDTRKTIPDKVSELSVSQTRFDRQTQSHHSFVCQNAFRSV